MRSVELIHDACLSPSQYHAEKYIDFVTESCISSINSQEKIQVRNRELKTGTDARMIILFAEKGKKTMKEDVTERCCQICGEWKLIEEHYTYDDRWKNTWCKSCRDFWHNLKDKVARDEWLASMRESWDHVPYRPKPDR